MRMPNYKMQMRQTIRTSSLERHVHFEPYVALVLSGGYEEAGDNGRFKVSAGNVVFHDSFEAHLNRFYAQGATVLNLPVASGKCIPASQPGSRAWLILISLRARRRKVAGLPQTC